jgi:Flp pilus assembly protein TadD
VSSLFTAEFFESARQRLAPGGVICQWVNAYNINGDDLRSVVATFTRVFPEGTVWLVGRDDVLLLATLDPIEPALAQLPQRMQRPDVAADLAAIGVVDAFSMTSLYVAGPRELAAYTANARIFTDDHLTLEFTAPRELHNPDAGKNGAALRALRSAESVDATADEWKHRAAMLARADHHELALEDYLRSVELDPNDQAALDGLVKSAIILRRAGAVVVRLKADATASPQTRVAVSKLLAADGRRDEAIALARTASSQSALGYEQLASLYAETADTVQLDAAVADMRRVAPERAATHFYSAVAAFLHGDAAAAVEEAKRAIAIDPNYTPTYDLIGAAYTRLGQLDPARQAFNKSLEFDAHDSTAYENLGVLELNAGNRASASKYFAEALWLVPDSQTSRQGLARAKP